MKNIPQSSPLDFLQIMSNVRSRTAATDRTYVYIRMPTEGDIYKTREQPTRRAEHRNHIDPEPYTRHGRRVRINKDFPSRTSSRTGEYFKHPPHRPFSCTPPALDHHPRWSPCIIHLLSSSLIAPRCLPLIRTFIISTRETFFIDCPGTNLLDTGCKLFLPFTLREVLLLAFPPTPSTGSLPGLSVSLFPSLAHFLRRFPRHVAWA